MVRYLCHNCDDLLLKQVSSVIDHVWGKHGVEVKKYPNRSVFRCEDCNISFGSIISFLKHIDGTHGIHIWYEKGLTRKKVFFDGILKGSSTEGDRATRAHTLKLGPQQKKVLEKLAAHPHSTITQIAEMIHGKPVLRRSTQYNSVCRSFKLLETQGFIEKDSTGEIKWHVSSNPQ